MAKKIGAIASLSIIGILIITTIILANVKINYSINCNTPTEVYVSYSNRSGKLANAEESNRIVEMINNSSKENTLSALFNGNLNKKAEIKKESNNKSLPSNPGFYVEYSYSTPQKLMDGDKEYEGAPTYQRLIFTVNNNSESNNVNVYVFEKETSEYYSYYYSLDADFYDLYNYLVECGFNV